LGKKSIVILLKFKTEY